MKMPSSYLVVGSVAMLLVLGAGCSPISQDEAQITTEVTEPQTTQPTANGANVNTEAGDGNDRGIEIDDNDAKTLTDTEKNEQEVDDDSIAPGTSVKANPVTPTPAPAPVKSEVKTVTVTGSNFAFAPAEIRVKKGDTVKIIFNNADGFHDFVIDEFNARTPKIQDGATSEIQFVADKTGTFEYYCSVGSHRAMGMKGNLIVE